MPDETQVSPAISRFYDKDATAGDNYWSPLAFVDLTLPDVSLCLMNRLF